MFLVLLILFLSKFLITKQNSTSTTSSPLVSSVSLTNRISFEETDGLNTSSIVESFIVNKVNSSNVLNVTKPIKFEDFKPSPQYNNFGYGFAGYQDARSKTFSNDWNANGWPENPKRQEENSIEAPWKSKVKFPGSASERPYPFADSYERHQPVNNPIDLTYNRLPSPNRFDKPQESIWKKLFGLTSFENKLPVSHQKSFYGHNSIEQPHTSYYEPPREHHHSLESFGGGISPFKKILKVLAAIIPIGLFISALTPTIITVSSVNGTLNRNNRKSDADENIMEKIASSIHSLEKLHQEGCEEKVFCELMVNSMFSKNAEEHIKNLLNNFVKREGVKHETVFEKILDAVKNQDCSPLICKDIEDLG